MAVSVFFLCFTLFAEVGWFSSGILVDVHGILCAVLTPVPVVILASPNILHHFYHFSLVSCLAADCEEAVMLSCKQEMVFHVVQSISAILRLNKLFCLAVQHKFRKTLIIRVLAN